MTPISRFLARYLPRALVAPALALIYAAMLFSLAVAGSSGVHDNIYTDVTGR